MVDRSIIVDYCLLLYNFPWLSIFVWLRSTVSAQDVINNSSCPGERVTTMASLPLELPVDIPGLEILSWCQSLVPSLAVDTPVDSFCFHILQEQKGGLVFPPAETSFSTLPPSDTYNLSNLAKDPIPPTEYLQLLKMCLNNLSDNNCLSLRLIHNSTSNHEERLPLWVLTLWDAISSLISSRNRWAQSYSWVRRLQNSHQEGEGTRLALEYFKILGWGSKISLYGLQGVMNLSLTQFLSDNCINGDAIDLMAHQLTLHPTLPEGVIIFNLRLLNFLSMIGSQADLEHPSPGHI